MKTVKSKRPDIQTFRSLAIFAVLAFHLKPDLFPLGYLGVDIFFVLSGYLMSMMLSRVETLNPKSFLEFYWRRISRILPIYSVVICAVAIIARFILSPIDYTTLIRDTRWSLVFGANIQQFKDGSDYWTEVNDSPILLHMWSLGAEVQYYLFVPFIVLLQRRFSRKNHQLMFLGLLFLVSISSFIYVSLTNEQAGFLLMPNRAWQFIIGSLAFEMEVEEEEPEVDDIDELCLIASNKKEPESPSRVIACLFIVSSLICFSPLQIPIRLPVSMFTGLLLLYGSQKEIGLLSNKVVVKVGNASYVLYLVHWPVITLYKYSLEVKTLDNIGAIICFVTAFAVSLTLHELVELKLLGVSKKTIAIVVTALYATTILVTFFDLHTNVDIVPGDKKYDLREAIHYNRRGSGNIGRGDCRADPEGSKMAAPYWQEGYNRCVAPGNGTAKILILGNSFAGIAVNYLRPWLQPMAKEIRLFAHHGCRILINGSCPPFSAAWPRLVENMKPDVTWIVAREPQITTNPLEEPIENDTTYQYMKDRIEFIGKHSKYVVVDYQTVGISFEHSMFPVRTILREISRGNFTFDDLKISEKAWKEFDRNETIRMDAITTPNLIRHKISEKQCTGGTCYFYNPANLHVYYADNYAHQTSEQMALLKPSYMEIIDQIKKLLKL